MQRSLLWSLLLLSFLADADGSLAIFPQPNGSLRLSNEGGASREAGWLSHLQPPDKALTLQLMPYGSARCENNQLAAPPVKLSLQKDQEKFPLRCGEPLRLEATGHERWIRVHTVAMLSGSSSLLAPQQALTPRVQIGTVSFIPEGQPVTLYSLYLDFRDVLGQEPTLSARFITPVASFGLVDDRQDKLMTARLHVTKTAIAGSKALPYKLTFESIQQQNNQWYLRSEREKQTVPYQIRIGEKNIAPDSEYLGTLPAGRVTSDLINIEFVLAGKQTAGLPAGTRLLDTLTAVITPDS